MTYRVPKFQVFQDKAGEWRWRLRAANSQIIAVSGEGYKQENTARNAARRVTNLVRATSPRYLLADIETRKG